MWTIDGLETFLKSNNEVISVLIGILSIVVSLCGVYFGEKPTMWHRDLGKSEYARNVVLLETESGGGPVSPPFYGHTKLD